MRLLCWTLGSLLVSISLLLGIFELLSFYARDGLQLLSLNDIYLLNSEASSQAPSGLNHYVADYWPLDAGRGFIKDQLLPPLVMSPILIYAAIGGLFFLWVGRHIEPDYIG